MSPTPHIYHKRHMSHNISQISLQAIQVLHHRQPQLQIEVSLTTTSIITDLEKDSLKHEDRSMPPIDSAQRRRDCMCETR